MGTGSRRGACRSLLAAALIASATLLPANPSSAADDPFALDAHTTVGNGVGRITTPGRPCSEDGGDGAYWHYDYNGALPGGKFAAEPAELRWHLDLHSNVIREPQPGVHVPTRGPTAFLLGDASHASLINKRGTIKVRLKSGDCANPTINFDGTSASGGGAWEMGDTAGAYREATGSGTFTFTGDVAPGADNPGTLDLLGEINILKPSLKVQVLGTYWGFMGLDYVLRKVTVIYKITNEGPGDAFGVRLVSSTSPTEGVEAHGPVPQKLGDLLAGESETVRVRYTLRIIKAQITVGTTVVGRISLEPCQLIVLNCKFETDLGVEMPDALDRPTTYHGTNVVTAPALPPPL